MNILIICLAQVLLSSILLFVYFKSRVSKVEEKLDIMFQLVQSHSSNQQQDNIKFYENNTQNNQINEAVDDTLYNKPDVNLISISDSEEEDSNEDSDEDSNEESEDDSEDEKSVTSKSVVQKKSRVIEDDSDDSSDDSDNSSGDSSDEK